jgi:hypothetical protein
VLSPATLFLSLIQAFSFFLRIHKKYF